MTPARRARCEGIFLIGGPPCTPFSGLGRQQGIRDAQGRHKPLLHFATLKAELQAACDADGLHFCWLLEEIASMTMDNRTAISHALNSHPVFLDATDWGKVYRPRLYWGLLDQELHASEQYELSDGRHNGSRWT